MGPCAVRKLFHCQDWSFQSLVSKKPWDRRNWLGIHVIVNDRMRPNSRLLITPSIKWWQNHLEMWNTLQHWSIIFNLVFLVLPWERKWCVVWWHSGRSEEFHLCYNVTNFHTISLRRKRKFRNEERKTSFKLKNGYYGCDHHICGK